MNDQERAAFEAWLNPGRHAGNVSAWVEPGRYEKDAHNLAWLAWNARAALAAAPVQADKWEGAEEWMPLAWELCANENGEDACTELVLEGGPIPEPWGDRWLKYEDQAKEMIALVRKHVPALAAASAAPVQAVPGWALVPLHATPEMVSAAEGVEDLYKRGTPQTWAAVFRAMLAAAPAAPQAPAVPQEVGRKEVPIAADRCPITGRPFWGNLSHPELGYVATYGGPFDTYTMPALEEDGELRCERYDHDAGAWVGSIPVGWFYKEQQ